MNSQRGGIIFRLLSLILLVAFAGIIYVARNPLLRAAAGLCIAQDAIEPADVIVVIGDDDFNADRATEAATLFHSGWAPQVVASGRMLRPYTSLSDLIARDLQSRGVPDPAIVRFSHQANDTLEEADALRVLINEKGWRRILLVTSSYHTRRARYIFRKILPRNVRVEVAGAPDSEFQPDNWWLTRQGRKTFFLETVGYLVALWELRDRQPASPPHTPAVQIPGLFTGRSPEFANNQALFGLHR
jgi:uncharacterized SAM-binding protein YcdF (DUF218 family)